VDEIVCKTMHAFGVDDTSRFLARIRSVFEVDQSIRAQVVWFCEVLKPGPVKETRSGNQAAD
jgi:hypothetical protein